MVPTYFSFKFYHLLIFAALIFVTGCGQDGQIKGKAEGIASNEKTIARGKQIFVASGCHACHGEDGSGNPPIAKTLNPPPRDFRDPKIYKKGSKVEEIAETIRKGIPSSGMPPYGHISAEKRELLAIFIRSLQSEHKK